ncbi:MAG: sigma-54 dependent transcriptional regulator [Rhodocyclaceae bacterium]|nr:sigma-54 dependent transcriptional regulator [Rhodocyclaceae bacterium]
MRQHAILIVEDEPDVARTLKRVIAACGDYLVSIVLSAAELDRALAKAPPELVFTDLMMPELSGIDVIRRVRERCPDTPVVVVSAHATLENAVEAVKAGAFDFLPKPFSPESVDLMLAKVARERELRRAAHERDADLLALRGESVTMERLRALILRVRETRANVLVEGESGTDKELVARAIHAGRGPFVAVNMAAVPDALAEAELFGVRRGAFTGAERDRRGLIQAAHGGTLFLDEVNAMSASLQAKLLRVIEDRRLRPVGGETEVAVDFRLIAAANQDLAVLVETGAFRRDLYHRLKVLSIVLSPLRERREDIPALAEHFFQRYARAHGCRARGIAAKALARLAVSDWPGNVRELENTLEQAVILCPPDATEVPLAAFPALDGAAPQGVAGPAGDASLAAVEARHIRDVLRQTGGNKSQAARILAIDYKTLLRKLAGYGEMP